MYIAVAALLVVVIALAWLRLGFWSGFLHMMCVIVAGALAFAVWEPAAKVLLGAGQEWLVDMAWTVGLVLPFVLILLVIRIICDKVVPANVQFSGVGNMIGGVACGLVSGTVAAGVLTIGAGYLRLEPDFLGYQPVVYSNTGGSLVKGSSLIFPVDRATAGLYAALSESTFRPTSGESLAKWRPDPVSQGGLIRTTFETKGRTVATPESVKIVRRYEYAPDKPEDLLTDAVDPLDTGAKARKHGYAYLDESPALPGDSKVEGFVVEFEAGAKESWGQIIVGAGQLQLGILRDPNNPSSSELVTPLAVISPEAGDSPKLGRWRFDGPNQYIASNSAQASSTMAFEFVVPKSSKPISLYIKGVRFDLSGVAAGSTYNTLQDRDNAVRSRAILAAGGSSAGTKFDRSKALQFKMNTQTSGSELIVLRDNIPFNMTIQKDIMKGLTSSDDNKVTGGGLAKFSQQDLKGTQGMDAKLVVRRLAHAEDARLVQVVVDSRNSTWGFMSDVAAGADRAHAPQIIDNNGVSYLAIGYAYKSGNETWLYYDPSSPIRSQFDHEMPILSRTKPDDQLILIFSVSKNVQVKSFALGEKVMADFVPPLDIGR